MARYALVENGEIVNWIEWDGKTNYEPDKGCTVVSEKDAKGLSERKKPELMK